MDPHEHAPSEASRAVCPLRRTLLVALTAFVTACDGGSRAAQPAAAGAPSARTATAAGSAAAPATSAASPPGEDGSTERRRLALAKPPGGGRIDREIAQLQKQLATLSEKTDLWVLLGRAWVKKARESGDPGFYVNARACADIALDIEPGSRTAANLRGLVLLNDHRFAEARDLATQILSKDDGDLMALGTLSDALLELGRFEEAAKAAQRMMDLKPHLPSYSRASHLRWLQGDAAAAKAFIRQAIDARDHRDPEPGAWALVQAALLFWHEGDCDGAEKGFDMALDAVKDYAPALVGKGRSAMCKGEHARAAELFERAMKTSPLPETAWLLGDARKAAGDHEGAEQAYARVVKLGRQMDPRTLALFWATKDREHAEALRLAEAERETRDDLYTKDVLAWALYRAKRLSEARAAIDAATSLGTKDARLLYHAGAIRIAQGEREAGMKLVREALKLNRAFDWTGASEAAKLVEGHDAKTDAK